MASRLINHRSVAHLISLLGDFTRELDIHRVNNLTMIPTKYRCKLINLLEILHVNDGPKNRSLELFLCSNSTPIVPQDYFPTKRVNAHPNLMAFKILKLISDSKIVLTYTSVCNCFFEA